MPTSINPWVLCLGISPGADKTGDKVGAYDLPTIGRPHDGFGGEAIGAGKEDWDQPYWQKVRSLCVDVIQASGEPVPSRRGCLSISGHLNLGLAQTSTGNADALHDRTVAWVPGVITKHLRPRVVIGFGLNGHLTDPRVVKAFGSSSLRGLLDDPPVAAHFRAVAKLQFRLWHLETDDGSRLTFLIWPNHPSQPPFGGGAESAMWKAATRQAIRLLWKSGCYEG